MKRLLSLQILNGRTVVIPLLPRVPEYRWKRPDENVEVGDMVMLNIGEFCHLNAQPVDKMGGVSSKNGYQAIGFWIIRLLRRLEMLDPAIKSVPNGWRALYEDEGILETDRIWWVRQYVTPPTWRSVHWAMNSTVMDERIPFYRLPRNRVIREIKP